MHLVQIPPDKVINGESPLQTMWPLVAPFLERAIEHSDDTETLEETARSLAAKQKQLWVLIGEDKKITAAAVTLLRRYPTGLAEMTISLLGGEPGHLIGILELRGELESWAKTEGCNRVRIMARKGWAPKLPDYKLAKYVMSKDL